jgi:hypothetical protein
MTRRGLPFRHFGWLLIAALLASPTRGAEPASATGVVRDSVLRMTEFFDTTLPGVLGPHNLALDFRPKFSDLRDSEYMRLPFELRYGLAPRWELRGGLTPFFPNPINSGTNHRWGPGELKLSARHDVGRFLGFFDETTLGAEVRLPLGHPPAELNDHYTHLRPFVALARQLRTWPHTTFYTNLAYDRSVDVTHRDPPPAEISRRNLIEFAPGLLFKPAEIGWFGEYRFRHIRDDEGWHLAHEIQTGAIWDVPLAQSKNWRLPGKWQLELGYKARLEEGRNHDHGISTRVNWSTNLREVLNRGAALWPGK